MYIHDSGQLGFPNFLLPFEGQLDPQNPWLVLSRLIPWEEFEGHYASRFSSSQGAPAKSFRMALGALIAKERLGCSDEALVQQVLENPCLQCFLGLESFTTKAPFEASLLSHFRQRLGEKLVGAVNESVIRKLRADSLGEDVASDAPPASCRSESEGEADPDTAEGEQEQLQLRREGRLVVDATCAPADIPYPTDTKLLNTAREQSESLIDELHKSRHGNSPKPRTQRRKLRRQWLEFIKLKKPSTKRIRKFKRVLPGSLQRNLGHLEALLDEVGLERLDCHHHKMLLVIKEVYRQQKQMFDLRSKRTDHRIVNLFQPHIRPLVRGKAGANTEFGAKLSASVENGYFVLHHTSFENFNESTHLIEQVQAYKKRSGCWPESVHADRIYRTQANRKWCLERGIRLSGPRLGRPPKDETLRKEQKRQQAQDERDRNIIEGKFGQAKRRFSLKRIMARLADTSRTVIALIFLIINLEKGLRLLFFTLFPAGAVMRFWGLAHAQRFQNPTGVFFLRAGSAERMSLVASQAVLLQPA